MTNVKAYAEAALGGVEVFAPSILMKSNLWSNWAYIAVDHERQARGHRDYLVADWAGTEPDAGRMHDETNAALVALVAVVFSLEAFHPEIAPLVGRSPSTFGHGTRQRNYLAETFRQAIPAAKDWQVEINWLYDARDDAAHFDGEAAEPVPHPAIATNVATEHIQFSAESAGRGVAFLVRVWETLFAGVVADPVKPWVANRAHVLAPFLEYRAQALRP